MKKNCLCLVTIVAAGIISLNSCKKEAVNNPGPKNTRYLPEQIKGSTIITTYSYLDTTAILTDITKVMGTSIHKYQITYNNLNQPKECNYYLNGSLKRQTQYILNSNGEVIKGNMFIVKDNIPTTLFAYFTLTYNNEGKLTLLTYFNADGVKTDDESYEYSADGNITKINFAGENILEYDNLMGMGRSVKNSHLFYLAGGDYMIFYGKNNLTKLNEISRSYKYNKDNYPTQMSINGSDSIYNYTIKYNVK